LAAATTTTMPGLLGPLQGAPLDAPNSREPRVAVAKVLTKGGFLASEGTGQVFNRIDQNAKIYSRDILVAIPGFKVNIEPAPKTVELSLRGNLPGLSDSPALESSVILHDSRSFDLDFTLRSGLVVLTNKKAKGEAKIWLRAVKG